MNEISTVQVDFLKAYADAWNARDIDRIMQAMTSDCVFEAAGGKADYGVRSVGYDAVRARIVEVWDALPDAEWLADGHFVKGNRGCSEWVFRGADRDGVAIRFTGCDFFTFRGGKIQTKSTFLKKNR